MKPFKGDGCFTFGKYRGMHLTKVLFKDPGYVQWCRDNIDGFSRATELALAQQPRLELSKPSSKGKGRKTTAKRPQGPSKAKKPPPETFQQRLIRNIEEIGPDPHDGLDENTAFNPDTAPW